MPAERSTPPRPTLLFVYYARHEWPLRAVLQAQKTAFEIYSGCDVIGANVAYPLGLSLLARLPFQIVVYHSTALTLRWYPGGLAPVEPLGEAFAKTEAFKIAMPHDDYLFSTQLASFLRRARVDLLLSVAPENLWPKLYAGLDFSHTKIRPALTHYLDPLSVAQARRRIRPLDQRDAWLRYRATAPSAWTGAWGQLKLRIGEVARASAARRGRAADISVDPKDTVRGEDWYEFLAGARATVGVEGGSSVFDPQGKLFSAVEAYRKAHPEASYAEIVREVLGGEDDTIRVTALSPRHLEAAATKTAQVLVRGAYSSVLEADAHYIPVAPDLSDMEAALDALEDDRRVAAMIDRAYAEVVEADRHTWAGFFRDILPADRGLPSADASPATRAGFEAAKAFERHKQRLIPLEVRLGGAPRWARKAARIALGRDRAQLVTE
jgi:hypothetical protein